MMIADDALLFMSKQLLAPNANEKNTSKSIKHQAKTHHKIKSTSYTRQKRQEQHKCGINLADLIRL